MSPLADRPINERMAAVQAGGEDPALAALFFQFGRYMLIGSSRPDSPLPAHLTGVWSDNVACRIGWTCDCHLDINTQMNYWIAELTNIAECHEPLMRWIEDTLAPSGRQTARTLYDLGGWVAHIFSNPVGLYGPRLEHPLGHAPDRRRLDCHPPVGPLCVWPGPCLPGRARLSAAQGSRRLLRALPGRGSGYRLAAERAVQCARNRLLL